jgi:translation elongation factor EF-G
LNTIGIVVVAALRKRGIVAARGDDHGHLAVNEVRGELRQPIVAALCPAIFDPDVATLDEARVLQATAKAGDEVCEGSGRGDAEEAHHRHRRLLRARRERPRHRAAEKANELTSPHFRTQAQTDNIVSAKTSTLIGLKRGIETTAAVHSQCRFRVQMHTLPRRSISVRFTPECVAKLLHERPITPNRAIIDSERAGL